MHLLAKACFTFRNNNNSGPQVLKVVFLRSKGFISICLCPVKGDEKTVAATLNDVLIGKILVTKGLNSFKTNRFSGFGSG